jgi:hypothetical protein
MMPKVAIADTLQEWESLLAAAAPDASEPSTLDNP